MAKGIDQAVRAAGGWREYMARELASSITPPNARYAECWAFLRECVWTSDEARGEIRQFPGHLDYLRYIVDERPKYPIFAVEKSRRMFVSWLFCAIYLHDVLTQHNHADYIASRKLETSCELLGRLVTIYERIPASVWPDKPAIVTHAGFSGKGYRRIDCAATNSSVEAVAQGKDNLRQYTASNILLDEFAFWTESEGSWGALKPTVEGGGHIDIVSTPELGSFMFSLLYEDMEE